VSFAVSAYLVVKLEPPTFDSSEIIDPVYKREVLGMTEDAIAAEAAPVSGRTRSRG